MAGGCGGGTASGKSTVVALVAKELGALVLGHDRYYIPPPKEIAEHPRRVFLHNYDEPLAFENDLLAAHLAQLRLGRSVRVPSYDYATSTRNHRDEWEVVNPCPVVLVDGILTLAPPGLRSMFNLKVFVDAPADVRLARRMRRDVALRGQSAADVVDQYLEKVRPMHDLHVQPQEHHADLVLDGMGEPSELAARLAGRIRAWAGTS